MPFALSASHWTLIKTLSRLHDETIPFHPTFSVLPSHYFLMFDRMDNFLSDDSHSSDDDAMTPAHASENEVLEPLPACFDPDEHDTHAQIHPSAYDGADLHSIALACTHLSLKQQNKLYEVLSQYPQLFDGTLCVFPDEKIIWTLVLLLHHIALAHTPSLSPISIFSNKNSIISSTSTCLNLPAALNGYRVFSSYPRKILASTGSLTFVH